MADNIVISFRNEMYPSVYYTIILFCIHEQAVKLQNIRSLFCKLNFVDNFLTSNDVDLLFLTESWLNSNISKSMVDLRNYEIKRCILCHKQDKLELE